MKFKVGDLIFDRDFPEDGMALVLEVKEPDKRLKYWKEENGYRCYEVVSDMINWYTVGYIEEECEMVKADTNCPGLKEK